MDMKSSFFVGAGIGATAVAVMYGVYTLKSQRNSLKKREVAESDTPMKYKLYHSFPFRSSRCAWLVNELGIQDLVEFIPVSLHGPDSKDLPKYKKEVHPHGTIPALQMENGQVMLESSAICLFLANRFSEKNGCPKLIPDDDKMMDYFDKIAYATSTFDQVLEPLYMQLTHTPEDQRDQRLIEDKLRSFKMIASVLSMHFEGNEFVCGDQFTTADCVIGYNLWWASVINRGELLKDYPILESYLERIKGRAAFKETFVGKRPVKPSGGSL